ncbi:MAG: ExbD/TolR family protein [Planctomycetota bacterium]|jgi:biopolymer transport protein ExbD
MIFSAPFGTNASPGRGATGVAFACSGLVLVFSLVLALGVFPASERREREIPVELASVAGGTSLPRLSAQEVVVQVGEGGEFRLGGREVDLDTLEARLAELVREGGETALTLRADAKAPHGAVARVFAAARKVGIRDAAVLTVDDAAPRE